MPMWSFSMIDIEDSLGDCSIWRLWQPVEPKSTDAEYDTHQWRGDSDFCSTKIPFFFIISKTTRCKLDYDRHADLKRQYLQS